MSVATRVLSLLDRVSEPLAVHAHCDIPCGVYDPEQARIEAESCYKITQKYHDSDDELFRQRCLFVKEERAELAKNHLSVLWSDRLKPDHIDQFPNMHDLFWRALKQCSQVKRGADLDAAQKLLDLINEIDEWWKKTNGPEETRVAGRPG
ncbi:MAG TPA: superoxide dismutase, Ni [Egibacteraceae bacterium]|nr:superoxide dismutase, Ni [Actinomycetota bacterium]HWB71388.1 superoxide dismutase, Ni [Egibacteraceae bacterium]